MTLAEIVSRTNAKMARGGYYMGTCPCHHDEHPSLLIKEVHDRIYVHCFAGCHQGEVKAALGLPVKTGTNIRSTYLYLDKDGSYLFEVQRLEPKRFLQRVYKGSDKFASREEIKDPPVYMLPLVLEALEKGEPIYLCEGEKDADAFISRGFVATTNPSGADGFTVYHARLLRNCKELMIVRDVDDAGFRRARRIKALIPHARVLLPAKGKDAFEHFEAGYDITDFVLERPLGARPASEVPRSEIKWLVKGLFPIGFPTLLMGSPGVGKSTFLLWVASRLSRGEAPFPGGVKPSRPLKILYVSGEDDLGAVLAPKSEAMGAMLENLHLAEAMIMDEEGVSELRAAIISEGYDLVIMDSLISILPPNVDMNSQAQVRKFLDRFRILPLAENECSLVVISHPNKSKSTSIQYRAMGSVDFVAFFRHVLFMGYIEGDLKERGVVVLKSNLDVRPGGTAITFSYDPSSGEVASGKAPAGKVKIDLENLGGEDEQGTSTDGLTFVRRISGESSPRPAGLARFRMDDR